MSDSLDYFRTLPQEDREDLFGEIMRIYDLVDGVLSAVAREGIINREAQLAVVEPFVRKVAESANVLSYLYTDVVKNGLPLTEELQQKFETYFSNVFHAFKDFLDCAEKSLQPGAL